jgi:hypothetical protein
MARKFKRPAVWAVAVAAWDVWRRLPAKQRKQAFDLARKHGPKVAKAVIKAKRATKK